MEGLIFCKLRAIWCFRSRVLSTPFAALRCTRVSLCRSFVTAELCISLGWISTGAGWARCRRVERKRLDEKIIYIHAYIYYTLVPPVLYHMTCSGVPTVRGHTSLPGEDAFFEMCFAFRENGLSITWYCDFWNHYHRILWHLRWDNMIWDTPHATSSGTYFETRFSPDVPRGGTHHQGKWGGVGKISSACFRRCSIARRLLRSHVKWMPRRGYIAKDMVWGCCW